MANAQTEKTKISGFGFWFFVYEEGIILLYCTFLKVP